MRDKKFIKIVIYRVLDATKVLSVIDKDWIVLSLLAFSSAQSEKNC